MKVMVLRTDYYRHLEVGGSFSHTKGFLDGLQETGHEYYIVSGSSFPGIENATQYEIPYPRRYQNLPEVLSIAYNKQVVRHAAAIIRKESPDFLYHRHSEFNYSSSVLAREHNLPLVLEFNGSEVWVKKNWGVVLFKTLLRDAEEIQLTRADVIVVVSEIIKESLVQAGWPAKKILVNPNGVNPNRFHPDIDGTAVRRQYGLEDKTVAGFVGTFGAWHGVEVLARAMKPTVEKNPRIHFLIVGDGTLRSEVERIIRDDRVGEYVTLAGSIPHSEIPSYLSACDLLLSPHVHNADGTKFFGSPTKLFEYMAMGKPIIASGVGQIGDVIHNGKNGLIMRERDHHDLAEKILLLSTDMALGQRLGTSARNDAIQKYSWQQNAQRVIDAVQPFLKQ